MKQKLGLHRLHRPALKRDAPEVAAELARGEIKIARAAGSRFPGCP
jgi:hypothetical protein